MPNPLDYVTEDQSDEGSPRRVFIYPSSDRLTGTDATTPSDASGNALTQAVAPPPQPFDIMTGLAQLREMVANYGAGILDQPQQPSALSNNVDKTINALFRDDDKRTQLWPERMIRSGATLPGEVSQGLVPVIDPGTGRTSVPLIERAQDTAGLMGGGALTERPGGATLGSGPVRAGTRMPELKPAIKFEGKVYPGESRNSSHLEIFPEAIHKKMEEHGLEFADEVPGVESGFVDERGRYLTREQAGHFAEDMGLVRPEYKGIARKGGLGSEMLLSDSQLPAAAVAAAKGPAPVFYSALEHATTNAAQDTMSPQQWLGFLKNTPGVKAEELAWTGLPEWLGAQKGKVKKEDVQAYLDEHKVEIKDVTKSTMGDTHPDVAYHMDFAIKEFEEIEGRAPTPHEIRGLREDIESELSDLGGGTKYSSYQLPGGENYREHLLTMPEKRLADGRKPDRHDPAQQDLGNYHSSHWDEPNVLAHVRTNDRTMGQTPIVDIEAKLTAAYPQVRYRDMGSAMPAKAVRENVITPQEAADWSRAREFVNEFKDKPGTGAKSLHIEEIQSDWHQQGRKQGYQNPEIKKLWDKAGLIESSAKIPEIDAAAVAGKISQKEADELVDHVLRVGIKVPDAPFKTTWPELALKRMIRQAAEEGYDRISWTPGEAQAARYDLSKQVKTLDYTKRPDGTYDVIAETHQGGATKIGNAIPAEKLADHVGKDVADKIVNPKLEIQNYKGKDPKAKFEIVDENGKVKSLAETREQAEKQVELFKKSGQLSGLDLKVGGEGMREFYDKMLPKMAEKIGKAHGVKVKRTNVAQSYEAVDPKGNMVAAAPTKTEIDAWIQRMNRANKDLGVGEFSSREVGQPVHYFDLPPSLKEHAIGKGFPLYMSGIPFPLTPVDYDPFNKDKK